MRRIDRGRAHGSSLQPRHSVRIGSVLDRHWHRRTDVCVVAGDDRGPYYVSGEQVRSDITEDRDGTQLTLEFTVSDASTCTVLQDAMVDIWHCDAVGDYSAFNADSQTFLRGVQVTDPNGLATFRTVYPGWYPGRVTHIHLKVHVSGQTIHTGQVFFDESINDAVYATSPYDEKSGNRTLNEEDGIYSQGGSASLLAVTRAGNAYRGSITLGVQLD